ncbi:MAG: sodium:proton antiporter [Micrococcaceae bacterium]
MSVALLLATIIGSLLITMLTHRWRVHSGIITLLLAAALSFLPLHQHIEVEPHIILGIVMPPLLYSAALSFSISTFFKNIRPIIGMGVVLVLVTCAVVTWLAPMIDPTISLAGAFVLAAVVAPPDAVTMVSEERTEGIPRTVTSVIKGESIVNDATALVLFSVAIATFTHQQNFIKNPFLFFGYSSIVGILIGLVTGFLVILTRRRIGNPTIEVALNIVVPFAIYQISEFVHASGVLGVITAGFLISTMTTLDGRMTSQTAYKTRLIETRVWPIIELLIESFLFAYIGFQLHSSIEAVGEATGHLVDNALFALVITVLVIAIRFIYVYVLFSAIKGRNQLIEKHLENYNNRKQDNSTEVYRGRKARKMKDGYPTEPAFNLKECFLVSWMGMRGIVTLAAAASIPVAGLGAERTKEVAIIQFTAFTVASVTLIFQGLTLPLVVKALNLDLTADQQEKQKDRDIISDSVKHLEINPRQAKLTDKNFDDARSRITQYMIHTDLTEEATRAAIDRIDLQQAAWESRAKTYTALEESLDE